MLTPLTNFKTILSRTSLFEICSGNNCDFNLYQFSTLYFAILISMINQIGTPNLKQTTMENLYNGLNLYYAIAWSPYTMSNVFKDVKYPFPRTGYDEFWRRFYFLLRPVTRTENNINKSFLFPFLCGVIWKEQYNLTKTLYRGNTWRMKRI